MNKIRIAGYLPNSWVNGDGCRIVVFVQGCKHHCRGCQNPDTWAFDGGSELIISELADRMNYALDKHPIDGVTLSGGDPFYQQEQCVELLKMLHTDDVWIYTGFKYEDIKDTELARLAKVIVDGEFIEELKIDGKMYGSSNQRIIRLR